MSNVVRVYFDWNSFNSHINIIHLQKNCDVVSKIAVFISHRSRILLISVLHVHRLARIESQPDEHLFVGAQLLWSEIRLFTEDMKVFLAFEAAPNVDGRLVTPNHAVVDFTILLHAAAGASTHDGAGNIEHRRDGVGRQRQGVQ